MQQLFHQHHLRPFVALLVADGLLFSLVNPMHASAPWLIIGYLLLGVTLVSGSNLLAELFHGAGDQPYILARRLLRYGAVTVALLVGLQSIGQLTVKDTATLLPLAVVAYLYYGYGKRQMLADP